MLLLLLLGGGLAGPRAAAPKEASEAAPTYAGSCGCGTTALDSSRLRRAHWPAVWRERHDRVHRRLRQRRVKERAEVTRRQHHRHHAIEFTRARARQGAVCATTATATGALLLFPAGPSRCCTQLR